MGRLEGRGSGYRSYSVYMCDGGVGKRVWCQVDREGWKQSSWEGSKVLALMAKRENGRESFVIF